MPPIKAAICKVWSANQIPANTQARVGTDANRLQWQGIKPFPDADVYITGDTFNPVTKRGAFIGWSEGALLNSERVLVNYFGLPPLFDGLSLCDEFKSKL